MGKVSFVHFSDVYLPKLLTFELPDEQAQFTALPKDKIESFEDQHRMVILYDNEPVGYFLLHATERVKDYSDQPNAMLLTALSINYAEQRKSYAKKSMMLLKKFVQTEFPECTEIVLAVNHKNVPAKQLYLAVGFEDTGIRKVGSIGEQWVMRLRVK
ncbi:GNAT family N-acetyltransferase [Cytobacillus spongiae]|uniref:GNAT family N-acetyltransferase n=1 Tax=Cytobacillus spongiae TaxID=2901381 RepID=UPI001F342AAC|nr:GNAT family N-acetyltransferase [Cytobacillus spongiae]UII57567.1 GNAT family N-acetyltransferase [Cytobacillus spongiae]